jgi:uncharacterized Tic20 family protein
MAMSGPAATAPMYEPMLPVYEPMMASPLAVSDQESRLWAVAAHLSALVGACAAVLGVVVGPFAIWLMRRELDPFAAENAREALNFNLSVLLYGFVLLALSAVTFGLGLLITLPAMLLLGVAWLVLTLMAALRAWNDGVFRYPFTIQFIR